MILRKWPDERMRELDERAFGRFAQAILQVRGRGGRHEERPPNLEQRGTLDALYKPPQMPVVAAQFTVPAAAGSRLEHHWQRRAVGRLIEPTHLCHERFKGPLDRCADGDFLGNGERL